MFAVALLLLSLSPLAPIRGQVEFRPGPGEDEVPARFRLEPASFDYELQLRRSADQMRVWSLTFPSPVTTIDTENNTVHCEYFQPRRDGSEPRAPAVVVLHILGADFALSRYYAARLADRGVGALFLKLPYYGERRPPGKRFLSTDLKRTVAAMRQGVCDVRRAVTWLASRPEVDPARLGVTGISLGGVVAAIAASVDPAIERAVLLLAGGGLAEILWEMPEAAGYRALWLAAGRSKRDLEALTRPYDPLTYAEGMRGKRVLMMAARVDEVIPPRAAIALWEAAGKPPLRWLDCGHYSAVGYLLPAMREAVDFLAGPSGPH
jgi:dienelactone hydrolase